MITGIDHIHVASDDMDASVAFYCDVIGFKFLRRLSFGPPEARREISYVGYGDILLEIGSPRTPSWGARSFALGVTDIDAVMDDLKSRGVPVEFETRDGFSFWGRTSAVKDPCGNVIELREWLRNDDAHFPDWQPERADVTRLA